ncbi:N-acetyltransferase [Porcipelethomonas sp.]|uniref:N-acetyltransferase n=1 Tax=Porcipelethomonas sp. TaxID=2981675 RepID=UPI003EF3B4D5
MIRQIMDKSSVNCEKLKSTCCGKRILSNLEAYGTGYDFCRFYLSGNDSVLLFMNDTLLISGSEFDGDELSGFAGMHRPFRIEGNQKALEILSGMDGYHKLHRNLFKLVGDVNTDIDENDIEFNPSLDEVYEILSEGFPNLLDYPLWLADTSHRIRHGISRVFVYKKSTTASVVYDIDGSVLVGQVATRISARGSGYARRFLKWLAMYLEKQNKTAFLNALDTRESFYREIGFEAYESEYVLERTDDKNESAVKGKLNTND